MSADITIPYSVLNFVPTKIHHPLKYRSRIRYFLKSPIGSFFSPNHHTIRTGFRREKVIVENRNLIGSILGNPPSSAHIRFIIIKIP